MRRIVLAMFALVMASYAHAQIAVGTWVKRESPQMSMVVDPMGSGFSITYYYGKAVLMTLQTPLDGSETPFLIDGKPSGQTYAGRRVDSRHSTGVIKMNGKPFATSKAELSADGKTITVENDSGGSGKAIEHWDKH